MDKDRWDSKRQDFSDWVRYERPMRHIDRRPTKSDPRQIEQEERMAPKEPEFL